MDLTTIIIVLVLAICMLGCCGGSLIKGLRKGKNKDDDKHKGCH